MPKSAAVPVARSDPRTRTALQLESIALRHQIAVLERSRTRRPCFPRIAGLPWILLSRWWSVWRESLVIAQRETVLRWCRDGWSAICGYRTRGRWRGGRPRVSSEVRHLVVRMARETFLWGAPRIHGELLMLGFSVSQATVPAVVPVIDLPGAPMIRGHTHGDALRQRIADVILFSAEELVAQTHGQLAGGDAIERVEIPSALADQRADWLGFGIQADDVAADHESSPIHIRRGVGA